MKSIQFGFIMPADQLDKKLRSTIDMGVDYFMLDCGGFPNLTTLELLVNEVRPAVNG